MPAHAYRTTFPGFGRNKNKYKEDIRIRALLDEQGVDTSTLLHEYGMVPPVDEMAYKDIGKYYQHKYPPESINLPWRQARGWLQRDMARSCTRSRIFTYEEVISYMNRSTSSTAFFNRTEFQTKGSLFDHPDFKPNYVRFVHAFFEGDVAIVASAGLKMEVRVREKIENGKARAFVVSPVYLVILDHQFNLHLTQQYFQNWHTNETGAGMSLFMGDYHDKMAKFFGVPKTPESVLAFYDVGGWDKGVQFFEADHVVEVQNSFYERFVPVDQILPELAAYGYTTLDTYAIRLAIARSGMDCFVMLPYGEVVSDRPQGELSGSAQTTIRNTLVHKLRTFVLLLDAGVDYASFKAQCRVDHTGDDQMFNGPKPWFDLLVAGFREKFGYVMDARYAERDSDIDYLSTSPMCIRTMSGFQFVPKVQPNKLFASLCLKDGGLGHLVNLQRIASVILLTFWDPPVRKLAQRLLDAYIVRYRDECLAEGCSPTLFQWPDQAIADFYLGAAESYPVFLYDSGSPLV